MQWKKLIPTLTDNFDPTQSAHSIPPEDIPLIIMLDGSSSIATLARLTDQKPEDLYARLQVFEQKGFLEWRETQKTIKRYGSSSRMTASLGKPPKILESRPAIPRAPAANVPPPPQRATRTPAEAQPAVMAKGQRVPERKIPPAPTSPPAQEAAPQPTQQRRTGTKPSFRSYKPPGTQAAKPHPTASQPAMQQAAPPPSARKPTSSQPAMRSTTGGTSTRKPIGSQPAMQQAAAPPPSTPAGSQPSMRPPLGQSTFQTPAVKSSASLTAAPATSRPSSTPPSGPVGVSEQRRKEVSQTKQTPPPPAPVRQRTPAPRSTQQPPAKKPVEMPLTSWELNKRRQQREATGKQPTPSSSSSSGIMDLDGFEETMLPSDEMPSTLPSSPSSKKTKSSASMTLQQAADEAATQMSEPAKTTLDKTSPDKTSLDKTSLDKTSISPGTEAEEEWDSADDWWALSPEDVGLKSKDYAELIKRRDARKLAMAGNREVIEDDDTFNPMWRQEIFGVR